eukprot:8513496-Heterocapsa_arctica.AAC.1
MTKRVSSVRASRTTASECGERRTLVENITRRAAGKAWHCESKGGIPNPPWPARLSKSPQNGQARS